MPAPADTEPRLIVFSGAGLSAESGLATFRGAHGLWEDMPLAAMGQAQKNGQAVGMSEGFECGGEFFNIH